MGGDAGRCRPMPAGPARTPALGQAGLPGRSQRHSYDLGSRCGYEAVLGGTNDACLVVREKFQCGLVLKPSGPRTNCESAAGLARVEF